MTWNDDLAKIYNYEAQQNLAIIEFNKRKTKRIVRPKNYKPGKVKKYQYIYIVDLIPKLDISYLFFTLIQQGKGKGKSVAGNELSIRLLTS